MKKFARTSLWIIALICGWLGLACQKVAAAEEITIYLFYGQECPHCEEEMEWLEEEFLPQNSEVSLKKFEVWHNQENQQKFVQAQNILGEKSNGVPYTVIGNETFIGYMSSQTPSEISRLVDFYKRNNDQYVDNLSVLASDELLPEATAEATTETVTSDEIYETVVLPKSEAGSAIGEESFEKEFNLPMIGRIDPKAVSLPLIAIFIGIVDGFNPCAMWILIFLITMLFGMKDRKKMWILGLTFLLTSALVYLLFMMSWLNLAVFLNKITIIRTLIAVIALVFGIVNINRYYKSRDTDACDVVNPKQRRTIMSKIKKITSEQKFILAILGIIALAVGVNLIELLCSLGLPVVFTQILSLNNLSTFEYGIYMLLYILFFLIDDLIVFFIAMKTLQVNVISSKYAKYSHLIGGIIMVVIGILMLFKPEWLMFNFG